MILKYGNNHAIKNFKGRTPFIPDPSSDDNTPASRKGSSDSKENLTFSSAISNSKKNSALKKRNTVQNFNYDDDEPSTPKLSPIYATSEHESEIVYSDLLQRLMVYVINVSGFTRK